MKRLLSTLVILLCLTGMAFGWMRFTAAGKMFSARHLPKSPHKIPASVIAAKLKKKADAVRKFADSARFNNQVSFLVDMSLPSGEPRFFVYSLMEDSVLFSGLVTHGRCNEDWLEGRRYGNKPGCGCTSLGKYKIGNPYQGRFGLAFKLHGLERTNDNAYARYVVLHSHSCVPETGIGEEICQSDGCPTVSPGMLAKLDPMIRNSQKPVLLWIFE
jgi:hypothetical protein